MSRRDGSEDIFVARPDGSRLRNLTRTPALQESHPAWAPSGELTYTRHDDRGPVELWAMAADGADQRRLQTGVEPVFAYDWARRRPGPSP
jgi:Tol biopolymer transport system component